MAKAFALLLAGLLSGCAGVPVDPGVDALLLDRDLTVAEGEARVFLQAGRVVGRPGEFEPHCALEIRHLHGPPRTVPAGLYPVRSVQQSSIEVVRATGGSRLAAVYMDWGIGLRIGGVAGRHDAPSDIFEGYHFWLDDVAGVGLMRLSCYGGRDHPADAEPPTLGQINRALGGFGSLRPVR